MSIAPHNEIQAPPPQHIAIIMDGNGRWAQERGLGRTFGHREGAKRVDEIVTECTHLGVRYLTLYAFSTENWQRPSFEINMLMRLLAQHLRTMDKKLVKNRVRLRTQGEVSRLPKFVQAELRRVQAQTDFSDPKLDLTLCLSYGGRQEIVSAARQLAIKVSRGELLPETIDEQLFKKHLYQPDLPDPELLIRTGGECRVSNFLLWEIAYTEFVVTSVYWPDFKSHELVNSIQEYSRRTRRFGLTGEQVLAHKGSKQEKDKPEKRGNA